jgi:hypothetical protein
VPFGEAIRNKTGSSGEKGMLSRMSFAVGLVRTSFGVMCLESTKLVQQPRPRLVGAKEEIWKSGWSSVRMGGGDMRGSMGFQGKRVIIRS